MSMPLPVSQPPGVMARDREAIERARVLHSQAEALVYAVNPAGYLEQDIGVVRLLWELQTDLSRAAGGLRALLNDEEVALCQ